MCRQLKATITFLKLGEGRRESGEGPHGAWPACHCLLWGRGFGTSKVLAGIDGWERALGKGQSLGLLFFLTLSIARSLVRS